MSKAPVNFFDDIIWIGYICIYCWVKWINILCRKRAEEENT